MDTGQALFLVYGAAALAGIMAAEAVYLLFAGRADKRAAINRRMKLGDGVANQEQVLIQLRKERGTSGGGLQLIGNLARLRTQSGITTPLSRFLLGTSVATLGLAGFAFWLGLPIAIALGMALPISVALPVLVLRWLKKRRHKRFGQQLPEALELITRGLKAGHPVPVAIAMVAREMPDPIGTEFGVVADEVTYGSDLVTALHALFERVGHEDLPLFVTAVSIQSSFGGNLREILDGLSTVIRSRAKLRRKVRAISTEGRMSAYILTAVPVILMAAVNVITPDYYAEVWHEPKTWVLLGASVAWLMVGNLIMFRMASFKF